MLTLIRCPIHPLVTAVARKRPRSFCQKCRWHVTPKHAYTLDPTKSEWAYAAVQAWCGNLSGKELTRNSSGNTQLQSSKLAETLWTDSSLMSGISVRERTSTHQKKNEKKKQKKKKQNAQSGNEWSNPLPQILANEDKATTISSSILSPAPDGGVSLMQKFRSPLL